MPFSPTLRHRRRGPAIQDTGLGKQSHARADTSQCDATRMPLAQPRIECRVGRAGGLQVCTHGGYDMRSVSATASIAQLGSRFKSTAVDTRRPPWNAVRTRKRGATSDWITRTIGRPNRSKAGVAIVGV